VFPLELVGNYIRFALATAEVASDFAHELHWITSALTFQGIAFDISIKQFPRVDLRLKQSISINAGHSQGTNMQLKGYLKTKSVFLVFLRAIFPAGW
jgi:hypothetical protein